MNDMDKSSPPVLVRAVNRTKENRVLADHVVWAGSSSERRRGLLSRTSMGPNEGIYLVPCEGVHTFGMKFPIDVLFLDSEGTVLALQHRLKPWRLSKIVFRADGVLELAAGRLLETSTEIGDIIELRDTNPEG